MIDIRATRSPVIPAKAGIQYAAASRFYRWRSGILGRPVKPGDDGLCTCGDLPVGQFCVESPLQKYFASPVGQIISTNSRHPTPQEGRIMIVTDVGEGCGGRGSVLRAMGSQGGLAKGL